VIDSVDCRQKNQGTDLIACAVDLVLEEPIEISLCPVDRSRSVLNYELQGRELIHINGAVVAGKNKIVRTLNRINLK
jgi:hypothetical protein